jgi:hypothetical protein
MSLKSCSSHKIRGIRPFHANPRRIGCIVLAILVGSAVSAASPSEPSKNEKETNRFLRLSRDKANSPAALETAILHCAPVDGKRTSPTVDLIAAIHIADSSYYQQLNREFGRYDAVLYELVAPENANVPRKGDPSGNHPITLLQNGMKDVLELEFQLKGIDYSCKNMVHADMSPDQFYEAMQKRGESVMTILVRMMGYAMARQGQESGEAGGLDWLAALFDKDRATALKRLLAEQFVESEDLMSAMDGPKGSTLISGRNKVALDVLRKEIASGKNKIAIFYGAGHMPDFLKRLRDEFGLAPVETRWIVAWDLKSKSKNDPDAEKPKTLK